MRTNWVTCYSRLKITNSHVSFVCGSENYQFSWFDWVTSEVKFPYGYVSKFSRCVEQGQNFYGMKSHNFHVFMQRLLPFVLLELLPTVHVHNAIVSKRIYLYSSYNLSTNYIYMLLTHFKSYISEYFFRYLCRRTLTEDNIEHMNNNIPVILCNLEKIFLPSPAFLT